MKMFMDRAKVEMMKKLYKKGERIVCDFMDDPQGVPSGTEGTITSVDDIGQIHVDWDNGSTLALTEIDKFHKI